MFSNWKVDICVCVLLIYFISKNIFVKIFLTRLILNKGGRHMCSISISNHSMSNQVNPHLQPLQCILLITFRKRAKKNAEIQPNIIFKKKYCYLLWLNNTKAINSIRQGFNKLTSNIIFIIIIILQIYLRHNTPLIILQIYLRDNTPLIILQSVPNYLVNILNIRGK